MRRVYAILGALLVALIVSTPVAASTVTIATFADPSGTATNPLFTFSQGTGTLADPTGSILDGGWLGSGLTLIFAPNGTSYSNVTFDFPTLTATGLVSFNGIELTGGSFDFIYNGATILTYSWSAAYLTQSSVGATDLLLQGVSITGSGLLSGWVFGPPQSFAFSFANGTGTIGGTLSGAGNTTWTSAFTSSATMVPEPGSLLLLGGGLLGLAMISRRHRTSRTTTR